MRIPTARHLNQSEADNKTSRKLGGRKIIERAVFLTHKKNAAGHFFGPAAFILPEVIDLIARRAV